MPIPTSALTAIANPYVATMTSIRGRRVHRLLMRSFARFDHVLAITTGDGQPGLLALRDDGAAALCCTDGRGPSAEMVECPNLAGATLAISRDLLKDSLPIRHWTLRHPLLGTLTIAAGPVVQQSGADGSVAVTALLRKAMAVTSRHE